MAKHTHPLFHGLYKSAYAPPPQAGAPGGDPAAGGGPQISPELMQIMLGGPPPGGAEGGPPPDPGMGGGPPPDPGMGGGPMMSAPPGLPGAPPGGAGGAPPGDVTIEEAAQVSPDVVSDHLTQLQSSLAVLQEGIKQLRRVVDSIVNAQASGGVAAEAEEPKTAYYRGIKPNINNLLDALKYLN